MQNTHFEISTKNQSQGIESVSTSYAETGTNIAGILCLKVLGGVTFEVPTAVYYAISCGLYFVGVLRCNFF